MQYLTVRMVVNQSMKLTTDSGTLDEGSGKNTHTNTNTTCDLLLLLIRIPTPETTRAEQDLMLSLTPHLASCVSGDVG